jgi:hypothetical protein
MVKRWHIKKAQAIAEMAIMSTLVLVVFGLIISTGQRFDKMEEIKMRAFRKALAASYLRNAPVSYSIREDSRSMDMFNFGKGQPSSAMGFSSVMWQKGKTGTITEGKDTTKGSYAFYEVNGKMFGKLQGWDNTTDGQDATKYGQMAALPSMPRIVRSVYDKEGYKTDDTYAPAGIYKEDTMQYSNYVGTVNRGETPTAITNADSAVTDDKTLSTVYMRADNTPIYYRKTGDTTLAPLSEYNYCAPGEDCSQTNHANPQAGDSYTMRPTKVTVTRVDGSSRNDIRYCDASDPNCTALPAAKRNWVTK